MIAGMACGLRRLARAAGAVSLAAVLAACEGGSAEAPASKASALRAATQSVPGPGQERWYTDQQVARGQEVFARYCASCHGESAQGAFAWRRKGPDGRYPAPPLNGTGHGWHHPLGALHYQIKNALAPGRGSMPPFRDVLSDEQILDTIAWFQSHWPDEIYNQWVKIDRRSRKARR